MRIKGKESKLSYHGHVLLENRHGPVVDGRPTQANGLAEREVAPAMRGRASIAHDRELDLSLRSFGTRDHGLGKSFYCSEPGGNRVEGFRQHLRGEEPRSDMREHGAVLDPYEFEPVGTD